MVISCAGSGKTSVILERTKNIIASGVPAENILVATFSKAAALEMKERFTKQGQSGNVKFSTIHSVCYSILANARGLKPEVILRNNEKASFFREEYIRLKNEYKNSFSDRYKNIDDFSKDMDLKISGFMSLAYRNPSINLEDLIPDQYERETYSAYIAFKQSAGKIDFDNMIIDCHQYLKGSPETLSGWQDLFRYIMIDEYQDTTVLQAEIFFMLAREKNICVVGDDDQSIYGFRDADSGIFKKFLSQYPGAKEIFLETNYRSEPQIIRYAANLIRHNKERFQKKFLSSRQGAGKITNVEAVDVIQQADEVVKCIEQYKKRNVPLRSIAILYRIKSEAAILCSRLASEEIPFYTKDPPDDIHKGMVYQDIKAYYRLANGLSGRTDLRRIINRPSRYISSKCVENCELDKAAIIKRCTQNVTDTERIDKIHTTINRLFRDLNNLKDKSPAGFMQYLLEEMGYRESIVALENFLQVDSGTFSAEFDALMLEVQKQKFKTMLDWDCFAEEYQNKLRRAKEDKEKNGVYLSTFHSAKGLEWDNVIIISANERITPFERKGVIENPEEERRLFYVAVTRANEELTV